MQRFGERVNSMPKHVATTTLSAPQWNATFRAGEVADAVAKLKTEPGTLLINGSADLLNYLTRHNLIDEYRIMIYPVVQGEGRRLWAAGCGPPAVGRRLWAAGCGPPAPRSPSL
jgi:dihydrofolate reductase